jgi:hypothetical protein
MRKIIIRLGQAGKNGDLVGSNVVSNWLVAYLALLSRSIVRHTLT